MKKRIYFVGLVITVSFIIFNLNCGKQKKTEPVFQVEKGVSWELAKRRKSELKKVEYKLFFSIPAGQAEKIPAKLTLSFDLIKSSHPLILDFKETGEHVIAVKIKGNPVRYSFKNGHIVLDAGLLHPGRNTLDIEFFAGDTSLNRQEDFMYTLFVPDRASTAFPCFDQPDLKAVYHLSLETPDTWRAVANGRISRVEELNHRKLYTFAPTEPLSTYLFAFVCGEYKVITRQYNNNPVSLYHRETDQEKIDRNADQIFKLVFDSLNWMEAYTGIKYPFAKYDLIAIPSFQYGGMEHTGATLYRASRLFLQESATINQKLGRANLIAHETAHMWFGDLVTMQWFSDVWMKEVFANFMADKIVNPWFPDLNHKLRFLHAHYPSSYSIDRTSGANPIAQKLDNMNNAGTLYGSIIYHKAPIVMNHLEMILGEKNLTLGLREYLKKYAYGNATYKDLISILAVYTKKDLWQWSSVWLDKAGMPWIKSEIITGKDKKIKSFFILAEDPMKQGRIWPQEMKAVCFKGNKIQAYKISLTGNRHELFEAAGSGIPDAVLLNGGGTAYGYFKLDDRSKNFFLNHMPKVKDPLLRGVAWLNLWENLLHRNLNPEIFLNSILKSLPAENNRLNGSRILNYLQQVYWNWLPRGSRKKYTPKLESTLWNLFTRARDQGVAAKYFDTYLNIFLTSKAVEKVKKIWRKELTFKNFSISSRKYTEIALELAVRGIKDSQNLLEQQIQRINNPDRKKRLLFIVKALTPDQEKRDQFFTSLRKEKNRQVEPWVTTALRYLHHPLRREQSQKYILPSLELLKEIQETGDIFFPITWLDATLGGHNSPAAAGIVEAFLKKNPGYPTNLRQKILQASDLLFRSAGMKTTEN